MKNKINKDKLNDFSPVKKNVITCSLTGKECIHSNASPDDGVYENCRLCDVFYEEYFRF